jgi:hypothetical protein
MQFYKSNIEGKMVDVVDHYYTQISEQEAAY